MHNSYNSTMRVTLAHLNAYRRNTSFSGKRTPRGKNERAAPKERERDLDVGCRFHGVMATPVENVFGSPLHCQRGWLGKKRRECAATLKKRGRLLQKENRPLDRVPIRRDACASRRLIGRTVACAEHIGKAIRKKARNYTLLEHSPPRYFARYFMKRSYRGNY